MTNYKRVTYRNIGKTDHYVDFGMVEADVNVETFSARCVAHFKDYLKKMYPDIEWDKLSVVVRVTSTANPIMVNVTFDPFGLKKTQSRVYWTDDKLVLGIPQDPTFTGLVNVERFYPYRQGFNLLNCREEHVIAQVTGYEDRAKSRFVTCRDHSVIYRVFLGRFDDLDEEQVHFTQDELVNGTLRKDINDLTYVLYTFLYLQRDAEDGSVSTVIYPVQHIVRPIVLSNF